MADGGAKRGRTRSHRARRPERDRASLERACRARSNSPGRRPGLRPPMCPGPVGAVHLGRAWVASARCAREQLCRGRRWRWDRCVAPTGCGATGHGANPNERPCAQGCATCLSLLLRLATADDTKAAVVAPSVHPQPLSIGRAAEAGVAKPRAAPHHPHRGLGRRLRVNSSGQLPMVPVATPLKHVPVQIMQSPRVGLLQPHLLSPPLRIAVAIVSSKPAVVAQSRCVVAEAISRLRSCPAGKFPLRFGRQRVPPTCR